MPWSAILNAVGAGVMYALTGYAKNKGETFDWLKFSTPVVIGVFAGIGMWYMNLSIDVTHQFLLNIGAVAIVEQVLKAIYRRFITKE